MSVLLLYRQRFDEGLWKKRFKILKSITDKYKNNESGYDCIIGVSGGKDSTRQALWVRDKLGLKPLLACLSYPPQQVTTLGAENISNLINLGFDTVISSPAPMTWKKLMKQAFLNMQIGPNLQNLLYLVLYHN